MQKPTKEIVQEETPVLREVAKPVPEELFGSPELSRLIREMDRALDKQIEGVAIAAPQLGVSYRVFIVRKDRAIPVSNQGSTLDPNSQGRTLVTESKPEIEIYINPEIIKTSRKRAKADEGCLSVRGVYGTTNRHERVTIRARRIDGTKFERGAGGLMAQIFEHEIDHLNGILFIDHAEHLVHIPHATDE